MKYKNIIQLHLYTLASFADIWLTQTPPQLSKITLSKSWLETDLDQMFGIFLRIDSELIELLKFMEQVRETLCL